MPVTAAEIHFMRSAVNSDADANGGRMSANRALTGARNNVFPDVSASERTAGLTRYRKLFAKVANDEDLALLTARIWLGNTSPGGDRFALFAAALDDEQSDISTNAFHGAGELAASALAGAASFDVTIEAAEDLFQDLDLIVIDNGANREFHDNVAVSRDGTTVTITLDDGDSLANGFSAGTLVASVLELGDIEAEAVDWTETSGDGSYDETGSPVEVDNIGGVDDDWTLTFTSPTAFTVSGAVDGEVGTGSTATDFAPVNPDFGKPYFILRAAGWAGTWAAGDTITFTTWPAAAPFWVRQIVPAGTSARNAYDVELKISGES